MNRTLNSDDLKHIISIARPAIIATFKKMGFECYCDDIKEVTSLMLEKVAKSWEKYDESKSTSSWFSVIAIRCAFTYMHSEGSWRQRRYFNDSNAKDDETFGMEGLDRFAPSSYQADYNIISSQNTEVIDKAVHRLDDNCAHAIWLQANGYSLEEIVEILNTGYGATRTKMSRGRKQLKNNRDIRTLCADILGRDFGIAA